MRDRGSVADGAPAYTGPATPLRAVLAGEHATRGLDWLLTRARSDPAGRLVLDMPLEEARSLVRFLDAWCDWLDETRERQRRDGFAPPTTSSEPGKGEWQQGDGGKSSSAIKPWLGTPGTKPQGDQCGDCPGRGGETWS